LDVSGNPMPTLPPPVKRLTNLRALRIRSMGLYVDPPLTPNHHHLTSFSYELPPDFSLFSNLTLLDFGDNRLEVAAPDFMFAPARCRCP
jgi:hypothetical protein